MLVNSGLNLRLARAGARPMRFGSFLSSLLVAGAVLLSPGWGTQRCAAQPFPPQGDDTTPSMGYSGSPWPRRFARWWIK